LNNNYLSSKSVTYISVDIECSGPIPGEYSMLSLGASVVGYYDNKNNDYTLYLEIQPLSDNYVKEALEIARLSLQEQGKRYVPKEAMEKFADGLQRYQVTKSRYLSDRL
jgi:5-bromo-4-chloroindolyl phosphate hydrolysis protein